MFFVVDSKNTNSTSLHIQVIPWMALGANGLFGVLVPLPVALNKEKDTVSAKTPFLSAEEMIVLEKIDNLKAV